MYFRDIPGQATIKKVLFNLIKTKRVPHAFLFSGQTGRGTLPLVRAFTALLYCSNPKENESCGQCENCIKTHQLNHPDIHFTVPVAGSKIVSNEVIAEWKKLMYDQPFASLDDWQDVQESTNKQVNINVKELEQVIEFASLKSYQGQEKVLVIWMAEFLDKEGNRLLKLIEEPPKGMYIFLITENKDRVLNTLLSRSQTFLVKPIQEDILATWLKEKYKLSAERANQIAFLADGAVDRAMLYMSENEDADVTEVIQWLRMCYKGFPHQVVAFADNMSKKHKNIHRRFIHQAFAVLDAILIAKYSEPAKIKLPQKYTDPLVKLGSLLNDYQIEQLFNHLNHALQSMSNYVNTKLIFSRLCIKVHEAFHTKNSYVV